MVHDTKLWLHPYEKQLRSEMSPLSLQEESDFEVAKILLDNMQALFSSRIDWLMNVWRQVKNDHCKYIFRNRLAECYRYEDFRLCLL